MTYELFEGSRGPLFSSLRIIKLFLQTIIFPNFLPAIYAQRTGRLTMLVRMSMSPDLCTSTWLPRSSPETKNHGAAHPSGWRSVSGCGKTPDTGRLRPCLLALPRRSRDEPTGEVDMTRSHSCGEDFKRFNLPMFC